MSFESKLKRMNEAVSRCRTVEENGILKTYIERPLADVLAESVPSSSNSDTAEVDPIANPHNLDLPPD